MSLLLRRGIISSGRGGEFSLNTANLNGSSQYFDAGNPAVLKITGNITISIRFKFDIVPTASEIIFSKFDSSGNNRSVQLVYTSGTDQLRATLYEDGSLGTNVSSGSPPVAGQWCDMTIVYNGSTLKMYLDAVEVDSVAFSNDIFDSTASWFIGSRDEPTPDLHIDGSLAFPRIWNTDLSSLQVTEHYNDGVPICFDSLSAGLKTNLVYSPRLSNWSSNAGSELVDQSTSGITTTNVGSTLFTGTELNVECSS